MKKNIINSSIRNNFVFWATLLIIFIQLTNSIILLSTSKNEILSNIEYNAMHFTRYTSDEIVEYYDRYNQSGYYRLYSLLDELLTLNKEIDAIYIISVNGEVLLSPDNLINRKPYTKYPVIIDTELMSRVKSNSISKKISQFDNDEKLDIVFPYIDEWGVHKYSLRYIYNFNTLSQRLSVMSKQIGIIALIGFGVGLVLIIILTNQITKPINVLLKYVNKISQGDLKSQIQFKSSNEIGKLFNEIDSMRKDLLKSFSDSLRTQKELEDLNKSLESRIEERTFQLEEANLELKRLSVTDKLTGIFNRVKLDESIHYEIKRYHRYGNPFSIIIADIDYFKSVNDDYGHQVGDLVLQNITNILKEIVRDTDVFGRWGGEEFMIVCRESNLEETRLIAERMRISIMNSELEVVGSKTASFGVSEFKQGDTFESIVYKADRALYRAKEKGRNRVETYSADMASNPRCVRGEL